MRPVDELQIKQNRRHPLPPATDANISEFERSFNLKLPADFVLFIKRCNGGIPKLKQYDDPMGGTGSVSHFYGLGDRSTDAVVAEKDPTDWEVGNIWGETRIRASQLGAGVPFASDGGGNQLFLDYGTDPPSVSRQIFATRRIYRIANSFGEFIGMLRPFSG